MKKKIFEIRFYTTKERQIYKFIEALYFDLCGVVEFESIKISKRVEKELLAEIQFKIFSLDKKSMWDSVYITESTSINEVKNINLFNLEEKKTHNVSCIICNSKAYIDNSWFGIGDFINGYKITNINQNSIEIQEDNEKIAVTLGAGW